LAPETKNVNGFSFDGIFTVDEKNYVDRNHYLQVGANLGPTMLSKRGKPSGRLGLLCKTLGSQISNPCYHFRRKTKQGQKKLKFNTFDDRRWIH
jgi:hypothetical protein